MSRYHCTLYDKDGHHKASVLYHYAATDSDDFVIDKIVPPTYQLTEEDEADMLAEAERHDAEEAEREPDTEDAWETELEAGRRLR